MIDILHNSSTLRRIDIKGLHEILVSSHNVIKLVKSAPSQVEGLGIHGLDLKYFIHLLNGLVVLIDFDVAAGTKEVTVLDNLVDCFIFSE